MVHYALMANSQKTPELEEPPAAIKSAVWDISREQMVDQIERRCVCVVRQLNVSGNMLNTLKLDSITQCQPPKPRKNNLKKTTSRFLF